METRTKMQEPLSRLRKKINAGEAEKFSFGKRGKSFVYAWKGILHFFRYEHNARIHLVATILVTCLSLYVGVSKTEAMALVFSVALVWITEMVNTAMEKTMDLISLDHHPLIKIVKDMAAGAVLVAALAAALIGCIIFLPKFFVL